MNFLTRMLTGESGNVSIASTSLFTVAFVVVVLLMAEIASVVVTGKWFPIENETFWTTAIVVLGGGYSVKRIATRKKDEAGS